LGRLYLPTFGPPAAGAQSSAFAGRGLDHGDFGVGRAVELVYQRVDPRIDVVNSLIDLCTSPLTCFSQLPLQPKHPVDEGHQLVVVVGGSVVVGVRA